MPVAALAAAHIGHQIEHSSALMGFLAGAVAGLAIGLAVVAVVGTGGAALGVIAAVGGVVASTGGGALAGAYIGEAIKSPKGPISSGSANVFYGSARIPAARAIIDTVACKDHGPKFLATGSDSVFINEYPAVRNDDKSECDGTVKSELDHIFIGAETVQYLEIDPEVPEWMMNVAMGMVIVGGLVAFGAGAILAFGTSICAGMTFLASTAGGILGGLILAPLGGAIGEAIGGELGRRIGETIGGLAGGALGGRLGNMFGRRTFTGHPVDVATGEVYTSDTDFVITGLIEIPWERFWISSSDHNGALGHKWHHPLDMVLTKAGDYNVLRLEGGRLILLPPLSNGQSFYHRAESLLISRASEGDWFVRMDNGLFYSLEPDPTLAERYRLAGIRDNNNNHIRLEYDPRGSLKKVTGTDGVEYNFINDDVGRITAINKSDGERRIDLISYSYDNKGDLVTATDASNVPFRYAYHNHLLTHETRRSGLSFYFKWDDLGAGLTARCVKTWGDDDIYWRKIEYFPEINETRVTNGKGATETYRYNDIGLVTETITPLGAISTAKFNRFGECEQATDANGATETWRYDEYGRLVAYTDKLGAKNSLRYVNHDPLKPNFLNVQSETGALGNEINREYDARGNLITLTDSSGHTVRLLRDERGLPLNLQDSEGTLARYSWTQTGYLREERSSKGGRIVYKYDSFGLLLSETVEGLDPIEYSYDPREMVIQVRLSDGTMTRMSYDADRRLVELGDREGLIYRWEYRGLPFPTSRINPDGSRFNYNYDGELNLVRLQNETGEFYTLEYDADQRLTAEAGFDGRRQEYGYDPAGNAIRHADGNRLHEMLRDPVGRLLRRASSDGTWAEYAYDAAGQIVSAINEHRKLGFNYDSRGLLLQEMQDDANVSHAYSVRGERVATFLPDGRFVRFGYDQDGFFSRLTFGTRDILNLARDRIGRENLRESGNLSQQTEYDPQGRIQRQIAYRAGNQHRPVFGRSYSYNQSGTIRSINDIARGERGFQYDRREQLRRVTGDTSEVFAFDPAGNILADVANPRDASVQGGRLLMRGDNHYEYDDAGNRIEMRKGYGGGHVFRYDYDHQNRLTAVNEIKGRTERVTRFTYDALGRRVSKFHREIIRVANDPGNGASAELVRADTTWFLWNGNVLLAEGKGDENGAIDPGAIIYVYEPGTFRPAAQIRRHSPDQEGEALIYWLDHLGTPQELSNEKGELVWQVALKAWGGIDYAIVERAENNLRFQGQYFDAETGLHYNRFRHYDPSAGCFINQDPIGLLGGEVLSAYAPNANHWVDPFGLTTCPMTGPYSGKPQRTRGKNGQLHADAGLTAGKGLQVKGATQGAYNRQINNVLKDNKLNGIPTNGNLRPDVVGINKTTHEITLIENVSPSQTVAGQTAKLNALANDIRAANPGWTVKVDAY